MKTKNRALFIDLLKGLALVVMIEVHVFNEFLLPSIKESSWMPILNFINGLVAPSFTFTSGLVFVLSMQKGVTFGKDFWRKMNRMGVILIAGYSLHTPFFSFSKIIANPTTNVLEQLFTVDILQLIATGLIFLLIARMIIKSDKIFYNFVAVCLFLELFFAPIAWKIDFYNYMPLIFANYFNKMHGSLFPIFPWWGFLFAGALVAKFYLQAKQNNDEKGFARKLIIIGTAFFIISMLLLNVVFKPDLEGIRPHPFFFLERLGVVFAILGICWYHLHNKENPKSLLLDVSRESLLVYWLHLQLIYRDLIFGKSLLNIYGNQLNVLQCLIITVILILLMMATAKMWGSFKRKFPQYARWVTFAVISVGIIIFFIRSH